MRTVNVRLLESFADVQDAVKHAFAFSFLDLITGITQVVSMGENPAALVKTINDSAKLAHDSPTQITNDSGARIKQKLPPKCSHPNRGHHRRPA